MVTNLTTAWTSHSVPRGDIRLPYRRILPKNLALFCLIQGPKIHFSAVACILGHFTKFIWHYLMISWVSNVVLMWRFGRCGDDCQRSQRCHAQNNYCTSTIGPCIQYKASYAIMSGIFAYLGKNTTIDTNHVEMIQLNKQYPNQNVILRWRDEQESQ